MQFDAIIAGGGLSGLGAGIRLSHFGKRVAIFERHAFPGGMNGFYFRNGHWFDAGLHAMTNIAAESLRSAPLNQILRQLRIRRSELSIAPQTRSVISFPSGRLVLDNSTDSLKSQIAESFPEDRDGFSKVCDFVAKNAYTYNIKEGESSRLFLERHLKSPLLREMLLFPTMYYGSATPDDMDLQSFCTIFKSIFFEGLGRPADGMRPFIVKLVERFRENGGELFLSNGISKMRCDDGMVRSVIDDNGEEHEASVYVSTIGAAETAALCSGAVPRLNNAPKGTMAFIEGVFGLERAPSELGLNESILFLNRSDTFSYRCPDTLFDTRSCLVCLPGNFSACNDSFAARSVKISLVASHEQWFALGERDYHDAKQAAKEAMLSVLDAISPSARNSVNFCELFTPRTIARFTGHFNGAIYGSPVKFRDSTTGCRNLFLCGTDQGLYGIVGSLISGTVLANTLVI